MSRLLLDAALSVMALPFLLASGYLFVLALLARRGAPPPAPARMVEMQVVVPAHDEEAGITETVKSLLAVDYPAKAFRVLVVADNCSDRTAAMARLAGAAVVERHDSERRGKGHALRFAFDRVLAESSAQAIVVVDADTVVSATLLAAFAARFAAGAKALQAHYGVRNASASWRTRLLAIAFETFHGVRSLARERLGLSCGLRGNGMAFSRELLQAVPHEACSLVEDLEYGIALGRAGVRVEYVREAEVLGEMAAAETAARSQRSRWEDGRRIMARDHGPALLWQALRERSLLLADLALDVLVPPLSTLVLGTAAGLVACAALAITGPPLRLAPWCFGLSLLMLLVYVLRGWALSRTGLRGLRDLLLAPAYITWKLALRLGRSRRKSKEWVRTARE